MIWKDLLGTPYVEGSDEPGRGLDCRGVCVELLRRAGRAWSDDPAEWRPVERIEDVGPGDVIGSDPEGVGAVTHTAVVVNGRGRTATTVSSGERGGVFSISAGRIQHVVGIGRMA